MDELKKDINGNPVSGTLDHIIDYLIEECEETNQLDVFFAAGTSLCTSRDIWNMVEMRYKKHRLGNSSAGQDKVKRFLLRWIESDLQRDFLADHHKKRDLINKAGPGDASSSKPSLYESLLSFIGELPQQDANRFKLHILRSSHLRGKRNERSKLKLRGDGSTSVTTSVSSESLSFASPNRKMQLGLSVAAPKTLRSSSPQLSLSSGPSLTLGSGNEKISPSSSSGSFDGLNPYNTILNAAQAPEKTYEQGKVDFKVLETLDAARQMTMLEFEMFRRIQSSEFHNLNWKKEDPKLRDQLASNIIKFVDRFNKVSFWVASEIVMVNDLKERVNVIKKFISIAEHFRDFGNYNGVMEIISGLNSYAVQRLQSSWQQITSRSLTVFEELNALMDTKQNYREYRNALKTGRMPCLPYLGIALRDIFFIEEGNPDFIGDKQDRIYNFVKIQLLGDVITQIRKQQDYGFPFDENFVLLDYFKKLSPMNEEELYKRSVECESNPVASTPGTSALASGASSANNSSSSYASMTSQTTADSSTQVAGTV